MISVISPQPGHRSAGALVRYDAKCHAITGCIRIDEVKDIRDKAQAMASYARQAEDTAMVEWATEIKVCAERRAGEMMTAMKRASPQTANVNGKAKTPAASVAGGSSYRESLESAGVNERTARRWQQLADIPADKFEVARPRP